MANKLKLEDTLLIGLGVASLAKGRMKEVLSYLAKQGKLATKDQAKMQKKLIEQGKREYTVLSKGYEKAVRQTLKMLNIPTRSEFEALKRTVARNKK